MGACRAAGNRTIALGPPDRFNIHDLAVDSFGSSLHNANPRGIVQFRSHGTRKMELAAATAHTSQSMLQPEHFAPLSSRGWYHFGAFSCADPASGSTQAGTANAPGA